MPLPPDFKHVRHLGHGYFAEVIEVKSTTSGRTYALKRLQKSRAGRRDYKKRLQREIAITKSLADVEGVISIVDAGMIGNSPYYTMPVASMNLERYIRQNNTKLQPASRHSIITSIARTMAGAHSRDILHRDLSPRNVLVLDSSFLISDFGLGKTAEELSRTTTSSVRGYGALLYTAPEQREKLKDATKASDVFGIGRLVDFIMTARDPDGPATHDLTPITRVATSHDAANRHGDAQELLRAIEDHLELLTGSTGGTPVSFADLEDLDAPLDWPAIHRLVSKGDYSGLAYYGYLDPVITFFEQPGRLADYLEHIGHIDEFIRRFCREVRMCAKEVGWPFSQAKRFYPMLNELFDLADSDAAAVECFATLWNDGMNSDQWAAQRHVSSVLSTAPKRLEIEIASAIVQAGGRYGLDEVERVAPKGPIRRAIQRISSK